MNKNELRRKAKENVLKKQLDTEGLTTEKTNVEFAENFQKLVKEEEKQLQKNENEKSPAN